MQDADKTKQELLAEITALRQHLEMYEAEAKRERQNLLEREQTVQAASLFNQEYLRQSEEWLKLALDAGQAGVWDWDIANNAIVWSERIYEFHGLPPWTFNGGVEEFTELIHPEDRELLNTVVQSAITSQSNYKLEFRALHPDGTVRWLATQGKALYDENNQPMRMLGVTIDITDRKLIERDREQLLQSEQMARAESEAANRLKDEFLSVVSHEIRTPLNAILGWANLLRTRKLDEATSTRGLEIIERNAKVQTQIVADLLDVSRIIRGQLQLNVQRVDLVPIIESSIDIVRAAADAKNIQIQTTFDVSAPQVRADPTRLKQIVWNLLTNAMKFTPQGGRVEINVSLHRQLLTETAIETSADSALTPQQSASMLVEYLQIRVSDTGIGISPEFLPYVFDRFRQADSSITRTYSGLGLGLAIVRHLVELHGGTVAATSSGEGLGSTFTVRLPN